LANVLVGVALLITSTLSLALGVFAGYGAVWLIIRLMAHRRETRVVGVEAESLAASGD
jgi:predicted O-methyltransferase YrrM